MVKTITTLLITLSLFICGLFFENKILNSSFKEFDNQLEILYTKIENKTAVYDDVLYIQKYWISKKQSLHSILPHVEIKEIDLWISETVRLVEQKSFDDALQKIEVVRELCDQIPRSYKFKFENIF